MASNEQFAGSGERPAGTAADVKQGAREFAGAAREAVAGRKNVAAEYIDTMAAAIDRGAQELEQKGRSESASLAHAASDQLTALAKQITDRQPRELVDDLQDFARRQPALCFGIAALAGFGVVRFLKSSADRSRGGSAASSSAQEMPPASETWRH
jgi:hypothetical protein